MYPSLFGNKTDNDEDKKLEDALISLVKNTSTLEKKQLLFLMTGNHGSSWYALLQLFTAHCHTSMQSRATTARLILENYEIEEINNKLVCTDDVQPDMSILNKAIFKGKQAAIKNDKGYITPANDNSEY